MGKKRQKVFPYMSSYPVPPRLYNPKPPTPEKKPQLPKNHIVFFHKPIPPTTGQYNMLLSENLEATSKKWPQLLMDRLILEIQELKKTVSFAVYLNELHCERILKQIQHVRFPSLKKLVVSDNNIESIEGMCRIYMPQLEKIWLQSNYILELKSLRRLNAPNLKILHLENNLAQEQMCLVEADFPHIQVLMWNPSSTQNWIMKSKMSQVTHLVSGKYQKIWSTVSPVENYFTMMATRLIKVEILEVKAKKKFEKLKSIRTYR